MGAWGTDTFENDDAGDWVSGLADGGLPYIQATLAKASVPESEYLESPDACEVLAACDVIARLRGNTGQSDAYTKEVDAWVAMQADEPDVALVTAAIKAIDRVLGANSELAELWDESGEREAWRQAIQSLRTRLTA